MKNLKRKYFTYGFIVGVMFCAITIMIMSTFFSNI